MFGFITKIIGTKSDKDIKAVQPIVADIHEAYEKIKTLGTDELRAKSQEFKNRIAEYIREEQDEINSLKKKAESSEDIHEKEEIYSEVDKKEKDIAKKIEEVLNDILPEAFSVIKEAAKRLKENDTLKVKATELDKTLAVRKGYIKIDGETATWQNSWIAAGNTVKWDMVHYDVQLIGGIVLHQGKISEMATGEGKTLVATLPVYLNALAGRGVH